MSISPEMYEESNILVVDGEVLPLDDAKGPNGYEMIHEELSDEALEPIDPAKLDVARNIVSKFNSIEDKEYDLKDYREPRTTDEILRGLNVSRDEFDAHVALLQRARLEGVPISTRDDKAVRAGLAGAAAIIADIRKNQLAAITDPSEKQRLAAAHGLYDESNKRVG